MAEPLEELFSRYDRQEPQPAPAMSTGVRMKPPVQPQERNIPTIGPASDLDAAAMKYGLKGDRPNPLMEMGGRGLAYAVGSFGDIAKAAHNQLFEPTESIPGDTEWMLRKLGAAGVTGQADIGDELDLAANFIDPITGAAKVASFLTMPAHFGLIRKMMAAQNSESTAADILKLKKEVEGYNFEGAEEAMHGIEDLSELVKRNQKLNTPFSTSRKAEPLTYNAFEKSKAFELNTNCNRRAKYGATVCALDEKMAKIRPEKPMLTDDELLDMGQEMQNQGKTGPCLYCYVEAGRRAKARALGNFMDTAGTGSFVDAKKYPARAAIIEDEGKLPPDLFTNPAYANDPLYSAALKEADRYAQGAAKAKVLRKENAQYSGEFLGMTQKQRDVYMGSERGGQARGPRFSGSNDFEPDQVIDWMQGITDLSVQGLPAYTYTKNADAVSIFAPSGMKINQSVAVKLKEGEPWSKAKPDTNNGMDWGVVRDNRDKFSDNVGSILVATNDNQVEWGLKQPWIDVVIPGHHAGLTKEQMRRYELKNYTGTAEKGIIKKKFGDNPNYWKIVNDVRNPETIKPVRPEFDFDAAERAYTDYVAKGGYPESQKPDMDLVNEAVERVMSGRPAFSGGGAVHIKMYDQDSVDNLVNQILKEN
jgi:hypothetical protein